MTIEAVLRCFVRPGMIVLDGGAGLGRISRLLTDCGARVHAFEPYAELRGQAAAQTAEGVFFYDALLGKEGGQADFFAAPGEAALYSTRNRDLLHFHPDASRRRLPMVRVDDLDIEADLIHLDIEGGECEALQGSAEWLRRRGPDLVIQTHGNEIDGIGGSVRELCSLLTSLGYGLFDLENGRATTATRYAAAYGERMGALAAFRRLEDPERLAEVTAALRN